MRNSGLVLFICAGLLLSGGAILGGSAGWSILRMSYHFWTSDLGSELASGVLLVAGAMLCLPACWLATLAPYHPRSITLIATLMFLSTAAMLMLSLGQTSMSGLSRALREPALLNASMHRAMARAHLDPSVLSAFSSMQLELKCCGSQSYTDWLNYRRALPAACCNRYYSGKAATKRDACEVAVFTSGCLLPAIAELRNFGNAMSVFTAVLILVLAVTLFASAYTLVSGVLWRNDPRALKPGSLRVACLHPPYAPYAPAQLVSLAPSPPPAPAQS